MKFIHCDTNEMYITLHDCKVTRAYLRDGILGFDFEDGFWISPDHPHSNFTQLVKTDASKVEYLLEDGDGYDVTVYVFKRNFFGKTIRTEWTVCDFVQKVNCGECEPEFLYQYIDGIARIVECVLNFKKKPYYGECQMKIYASKVNYYWNNLCEDITW